MGNTNIKKITIKDKKGSPLVLDLEDFLNTGNSSVNRNLFIYNKATLSNLSRTNYSYTQINSDIDIETRFQIVAVYLSGVESLYSKIVKSAQKVSCTFTTTKELHGITLGVKGSKIDSVCTINFEKPYKANTTFTVSFVVTNLSQGNISFQDIKIEEGNTATEWSVAPEEDFPTLHTSPYGSIIQTDKSLSEVEVSLYNKENTQIRKLMQVSTSGDPVEYGSESNYTVIKEISIPIKTSGYYKISSALSGNGNTNVGATLVTATQSGEVLKTTVKNPKTKLIQGGNILKEVSSDFYYNKLINFTIIDNEATKSESGEGSITNLHSVLTDVFYLQKGTAIIQIEAIIYQKVALSSGQEGSVYSNLIFDYTYSVESAERQIILANDGIAITQAGGAYFKIYNSQSSLLNVQMIGLPTDGTNLETGQLYSNDGVLMIKE